MKQDPPGDVGIEPLEKNPNEESNSNPNPEDVWYKKESQDCYIHCPRLSS